MESKNSHEECVSNLRNLAVQVAKEILQTDNQLVVNCREMDRILYALEADTESDPLIIFPLVKSEAGRFPIGVAPDLLDPDYRMRTEREVHEMGLFYRDAIHAGALAVIEIYNNAQQLNAPEPLMRPGDL